MSQLNNIKCIDRLTEEDLKGKYVLLRTDFNIPIGENGLVEESETWRILKTLPTIQFLQECGAKTVIISHIGRNGDESLKPIFEYLKNKDLNIGFIPKENHGESENIIRGMQNGGLIMLENLRSNAGEIENDIDFAKKLADGMDLFINEAFSVSHREHASIVSIPTILPSFAGIQFCKEIKNLEKIMNPEKPFGLILGGAKMETKIPLLEKFVDKSDWILVGGGIANTILKSKGFEIGKSIIDEENNLNIEDLDKKILLPEYYTVNEDAEEKHRDDITAEDQILDIAPKSIAGFENKIAEAKTILWNGPLGLYESGFTEGTEKLLDILKKHNGFCVVGGGDSVKLVLENNNESTFNFISTAGGAMLDFLVNETLPGIEALKE